MKLIFWERKNFISSQLKTIDGRLAKLDREIENLSKFVEKPRPKRQREATPIVRRLNSNSLPDSEKRFVSYLSAGSFQTIGLRKHERRSAKIKMAILVVAVVTVVAILIYSFFKSLF